MQILFWPPTGGLSRSFQICLSHVPAYWEGFGLGIGCVRQWHAGVRFIYLLFAINLRCVWLSSWEERWAAALCQGSESAADYAVKFERGQFINKDLTQHCKLKLACKNEDMTLSQYIILSIKLQSWLYANYEVKPSTSHGFRPMTLTGMAGERTDSLVIPLLKPLP